MKLRNTVNLSDYIDSLVSYNVFLNEDAHCNSEQINKVKEMLEESINTLLTEKQRKCVVRHYFEGVTMKDIAKEMGVCPSTVTRTIQLAKKRLSILSYFLQ